MWANRGWCPNLIPIGVSLRELRIGRGAAATSRWQPPNLSGGRSALALRKSIVYKDALQRWAVMGQPVTQLLSMVLESYFEVNAPPIRGSASVGMKH